ncbi:hypothetical protein Sliba_69520 [Streptomyces nigrescens]|uniref:Uncharacterized protein n=1 Tax=Streptomyces nigrescens TaxID=1920 RepID=A0A640TSW5_STRNI|nr:hypothetical protein Sliba_69520 [Streptomyces libani subsp. libani]GGW08773.1 hypothetical protein GCM10010500_80220 [Streptomyces libani subsp. libani]
MSGTAHRPVQGDVGVKGSCERVELQEVAGDGEPEDEHEIPVREGVRTPAGNGPGPKREDLPPLHSQGAGGAVGKDANTNNAPTRTEFGHLINVQAVTPVSPDSIRQLGVDSDTREQLIVLGSVSRTSGRGWGVGVRLVPWVVGI